MKKSLLVMAIAALGSTAYAAPYYMPNPSYTPNTATPIPDYAAPRGYDYDAKSTPINSSLQNPVSTFALEIGPNYTCTLGESGGEEIDTIGADITGVYNLTENWALTLRGSWGYGSKNIDGIDVTTNYWSIAPGLRFTYGITENLSVFIGASVGYEYGIFSIEGDNDDPTGSGLSYGIEVGLKYALNDSLYLYGAAQYCDGITTLKDDGLEYEGKCINLRVGIGYEF